MGSSATTLADTKTLLRELLRSFHTHGATPGLLPALSRAVSALAIPLASRAYRRDFTEPLGGRSSFGQRPRNYVWLLGGEQPGHKPLERPIGASEALPCRDLVRRDAAGRVHQLFVSSIARRSRSG